MCLICIEFSEGRMSAPEAYRALREYDDSTDEAKKHKSKVLADIHKRVAENLREYQLKKLTD